eukprot:7529587-Pyramimonas_sp.AAC.1
MRSGRSRGWREKIRQQQLQRSRRAHQRGNAPTAPPASAAQPDTAQERIPPPPDFFCQMRPCWRGRVGRVHRLWRR